MYITISGKIQSHINWNCSIIKSSNSSTIVLRHLNSNNNDNTVVVVVVVVVVMPLLHYTVKHFYFSSFSGLAVHY
jgi:hypothetical protein